MKGVYILNIFLKKDIRLRVGSLGVMEFKKGYYIYTGSAMGGLEQRIRRHLRKTKKLHWHVDYLLQKAEIKDVRIKESFSKQEECRTANLLSAAGGAIVPGFGCSDCKCKTHLYYFKNPFTTRIANYKTMAI